MLSPHGIGRFLFPGSHPGIPHALELEAALMHHKEGGPARAMGMAGWLHSQSLGNTPCQQHGWRGVQPKSALCSCSALPGMDSPCSICCEAGTDSLQQWQEAQPCRCHILPLWALPLPCWRSGGTISGSPSLSVFKRH